MANIVIGGTLAWFLLLPLYLWLIKPKPSERNLWIGLLLILWPFHMVLAERVGAGNLMILVVVVYGTVAYAKTSIYSRKDIDPDFK
jgi:hypothetical protein